MSRLTLGLLAVAGAFSAGLIGCGSSVVTSENATGGDLGGTAGTHSRSDQGMGSNSDGTARAGSADQTASRPEDTAGATDHAGAAGHAGQDGAEGCLPVTITADSQIVQTDNEARVLIIARVAEATHGTWSITVDVTTASGATVTCSATTATQYALLECPAETLSTALVCGDEMTLGTRIRSGGDLSSDAGMRSCTEPTGSAPTDLTTRVVCPTSEAAPNQTCSSLGAASSYSTTAPTYNPGGPPTMARITLPCRCDFDGKNGQLAWSCASP